MKNEEQEFIDLGDEEDVRPESKRLRIKETPLKGVKRVVILAIIIVIMMFVVLIYSMTIYWLYPSEITKAIWESVRIPSFGIIIAIVAGYYSKRFGI